MCNAVEIPENAAGVRSDNNTRHSERHFVAISNAQSVQVHVLSKLRAMEVFMVWQTKSSSSRLLHNIPGVCAVGTLRSPTGKLIRF